MLTSPVPVVDTAVTVRESDASTSESLARTSIEIVVESSITVCVSPLATGAELTASAVTVTVRVPVAVKGSAAAFVVPSSLT